MCTFHFEEFALYGANRSLFQTSVETPKSLFLIPPSEERKYFAKSFRNLSAIGDTVGRWSLSGKIAEKEVLKKHKQQKNFFRGQEGFKRWGITLQYFKENWSSGPFSAEMCPDHYYIITYIMLLNNIWTVPNCSFPRLDWRRFLLLPSLLVLQSRIAGRHNLQSPFPLKDSYWCFFAMLKVNARRSGCSRRGMLALKN